MLRHQPIRASRLVRRGTATAVTAALAFAAALAGCSAPPALPGAGIAILP